MAAAASSGLAEVLQLVGPRGVGGAVATGAMLAAGHNRGSQQQPVFAVAWCESGGLLPGILQPLARDLQATRYYKHHAIRPPGVASVFAPRNLAICALKGGILSLQPVMDPWFREVVERERAAEERGDPPPDLPPLPDLGTALASFQTTVLRDLSIQVVRRTYELLAAAHASRRFAWKLLKDVRASAGRKAGRGWGVWRMSAATAATAMRSTCLNYVAELTVTQALDCYAFCAARALLPGHKPPAAGAEKAAPRWLARKTAFNVLYVTVRCAGAGATAGLLANVSPGKGAFIGLAVGDLVAGTAVVCVFGHLTQS
eukprot:jgi/Tetstr1/438799/TSEL_027308.t1